MKRKKIHLVCNAHLDPVWLWSWEDGLAEALSTFASAADFCERWESFVFNHNEALLYHWVERHDPALFERIRALVARGRWHITGGSWVQPDLNLPHGESHIRQFLIGLGYFRAKFGVRPRTATNFDPFGQPEGYPQILAGCGMESYLFCRPDHGSADLPVGCFRFSDRSGAEVLARRCDEHYLSQGDLVARLERWLPHFAAEPQTLILWGAGNHGGGATRAEYEQLQGFAAAHPELEILHSSPERFFAAVKRRRAHLPAVRGEIQECFAGCYTSMSRVKRAHRESESLMAATERLCTLTWWLDDALYPHKDLEEAWRDILFAMFHDVLPGSGVPRVEEDSLQLLAHAREILRRLRLEALLALLRSEKPPRAGEVPIFVWNPHGFRARALVEVEYCLAHHARGHPQIELRSEGRRVPFQIIEPENNLPDPWIVRLALPLDLPPWRIQRIDATVRWERAAPATPPRRRPQAEELRFDLGSFSLAIDPSSGLVDRLELQSRRGSLVRPGAFAPVLFRDLDHSWSAGDPEQMDGHECWSQAPPWKAPAERLRLATISETAALSPLASDKWSPARRSHARPLRIVEEGPVCTVIEVFLVGGPTAIVRHYVIAPRLGWFEIRDRIFFNHRDHLLKLEVPLRGEPRRSVCETPYSAASHRPSERCEDHPNQRWVAVEAGDGATLAVASTGSFGHHLTRAALGLNVLRAPAYASLNIAPGDPRHDRRFQPRQDQGEHRLRWALRCLPRFEERPIAEMADLLNIPPHTQVHYGGGGGGDPHPLRRGAPPIAVKPRNVRLVALKKAERGETLIVRLQEVAGRASTARIELGGAPAITLEVPRYGLRTVALERRRAGLRARELNLVEDL